MIRKVEASSDVLGFWCSGPAGAEVSPEVES
jgi:hypothetical protein